jgi:HEAT repeat protein
MVKKPITLDDIIPAFLDAEKTLPPRFIYKLSDLEGEDLQRVTSIWSKIPVWRRKALLEDAEQLGESDSLLSFENLARLAVQDENAEVRLPAVRTLWEFESFDLVRVFSKLLENDPDVEVRAAAATGLGRFVYAGEVDTLPRPILEKIEDLLEKVITGNDRIKVRVRALESLGYSDKKSVQGLIEKAYSSGEKEWMSAALFAMGRSANRRWRKQVMESLNNRNPNIRTEAARASGELELKETRFRLLELLEDSEDTVRMASIWSLAQIGGPGIQNALEHQLKSTHDETEHDFIQEALDQLAFTEGPGFLPVFNVEDDEEIHLADEEEADEKSRGNG